MTLLVLGLFVFVGIHVVPAAPGLRKRLVGMLGENAYKGVFAIASLAGLLLIVLGKGRAPFVPLWQPPAWGWQATIVLMALACLLLPAAYMPSNVKRFTRHPMLWAVTLWAFGHLFANGDAASLVLFGGLALYALFAMWSANVRGALKSPVKYPVSKDAIVIVVGLVIYAVLMTAHPYLFGVPALR